MITRETNHTRQVRLCGTTKQGLERGAMGRRGDLRGRVVRWELGAEKTNSEKREAETKGDVVRM